MSTPNDNAAGGSPASDPELDAGMGVDNGSEASEEDFSFSDSELEEALTGSPSPGDDDDEWDDDLPPEGGEDDPEGGESDDDPEGDKVEGDEPEKEDGGQAKIDELTGQVRERDEKLAEMEARLQAAEQRAQQSEKLAQQGYQSQSSFADVETGKDFQAKHAQLTALKKQLRANLATGMTMPGPDGEEKEYSPEQVAAALENVEKQLEVELPQRREFLLDRRKHDESAKAFWPDLFKDGTEMAKFADQAWSQYPFLKDIPHAHIFLGTYWEGVNAIKARQEAAAKEKEPEEKKPELPKPAGKVARKRARVAAAGNRRQASAPSSGESLESYLEGGLSEMFGE